MTTIQQHKFTYSARPFLMLTLVIFAIGLAACSTDGSKAAKGDVVFSATANENTDIYKVDDKTGDISRLTTAVGNDYSPTWSPKKDRIAFLSDRNGSPALWLMDWTGDLKRQLSEPGMTIGGFHWAPDSERIGIEIKEAGTTWIAVINIETGDLDPLTSQNEDVRIGGWSPDGEWLLYAAVNSDANGIRRRNPNGVDEITITTGEDSAPQWSPDGRWIAFNRVSEDGVTNLAVTDKDGENITEVAPDEFAETGFDWAPNSKQLVYVSELTGNAEIYIVEPNGKNIKQLTSNRVADAAPRWDYEGASMLFLSEGDGSFDIYTMDKNGEQQKRMTSISDVILEANW